MLDVVVAFAIATLVLARIFSRLDMCVPVLVLVGAVLLRAALSGDSPPQATAIDLAVLAVLAADLLSAELTLFPLSSRLALDKAALEATLYFLLRVGLRRDWQWRGSVLVLSGAAGLLSFADSVVVIRQGLELSRQGAADLTQFRHLLYGARSVIESSGGEWVTFCIILLPLPLGLLTAPGPRGARLFGAAAVLALAASALLTLSRGGYVALTVLASVGSIGCVVRGLCSWRRAAGVAAGMGAVLAVALGATPLGSGVVRTAGMFTSVSHVRSVEGRLAAWSDALRLAEGHPFLGSGSGSFAWRSSTGRARAGDRPFAARPMNLALQLLVEQGLVGLGVHLLLWTALLAACARRAASAEPGLDAALAGWLLAAGLAVLVREATYSSLLYNRGVGAVMSVWLAIAARFSEHR